MLIILVILRSVNRIRQMLTNFCFVACIPFLFTALINSYRFHTSVYLNKNTFSTFTFKL